MTAAIWVALITGVLGFVTGVLNFFVNRAQLKHQQQQFKSQLAQAREQMLLEHPDVGRIHNADLSAIHTIRGLLQDERYKGRTFATIRLHLPARTDEEIRSLLRSMGAIRLNNVQETWRLPDTHR